MTAASERRIKRFTDWFIRSEYLANWQSENIDSGGYARPGSDARDRYNRCYEAAADGGDGSTHREHIDDWRGAFRDWLSDHRRGKWGNPDRFEAAVNAYFDSVEAWHEQNGSIDEEIG